MNTISSIVSIRCKDNGQIRHFLVDSPSAKKWVEQTLSSNKFEFVNENMSTRSYHPERTQRINICVSFG